jgi:hypothetical protein
MIQQYVNEINKSKHLTDEARRQMYEKQNNIRVLEDLLNQKRNILANKQEEQRVMLIHLE